MNYLELFYTALSALRSNVLRTTLTMLGIIIGITSVILIITLAQGATSSITSQVSALGTNLIFITPGYQSNRGGPQAQANVTTLTYDDAGAITQLSHVEAVSAVDTTKTQVVANGQNSNIAIQGVQAAYQTVQNISLSHGSFITQGDEEGLSRVAVLGPQVVNDLFGQDSNPVGQSIEIGSKFFLVEGETVAKGSSGFSNPDNTVYIPVTTAQTELLGQNYVQYIMVDTDDPTQVNSVSNNIKQLLLTRHKITGTMQQDFTITTSQGALSTLNTITGILTTMLAGIAGISLLVGGIGIMNIMLVTVTERTKEIGLLKAIGAEKKDILTQFLIEALVLTLSGGVVGIILGISFAYILSTGLLHIDFILQPFAIVLAVGVSTIVGIVFGLYPAQRAANLSPIDALRFE